MSDLFWLTDDQMARLQPYFPKSHGRERVDDRRVLSGIIFVNRNGLRWRDAPREYGPAKTLYNRWKRWRHASADYPRLCSRRGRLRRLTGQVKSVTLMKGTSAHHLILRSGRVGRADINLSAPTKWFNVHIL